VSDKKVEATLRLFNRIADQEFSQPELWAEQGYRAYALALFQQCAEAVGKVTNTVGNRADMTLIMQTVEAPWGKSE